MLYILNLMSVISQYVSYISVKAGGKDTYCAQEHLIRQDGERLKKMNSGIIVSWAWIPSAFSARNNEPYLTSPKSGFHLWPDTLIILYDSYVVGIIKLVNI